MRPLCSAVRVKDLFAERLELRQRARLVLAHQPRVARNVGGEDRRKPSLDALLRHEGFPPQTPVGSEILCGASGEVHRDRI